MIAIAIFNVAVCECRWRSAVQWDSTKQTTTRTAWFPAPRLSSRAIHRMARGPSSRTLRPARRRRRGARVLPTCACRATRCSDSARWSPRLQLTGSTSTTVFHSSMSSPKYSCTYCESILLMQSKVDKRIRSVFEKRQILAITASIFIELQYKYEF